MRGDDIDTDQIIPGRYLKSVSFEGLEQHMFEDHRKAWLEAGPRRNTTHPFDDARYQGASVLIVNSNFGCGSSREHAPQGLQRWGFRVVIGESFAEIFFGNSLMIGLACVTASAKDIEALMALVERDPKAMLTVDLKAGTCRAPGMTAAVSIPDHVRDTLMTGAWDTTGLLLDRYEQVNAVSARLPYLNGFSASPR